MKDTRRARGERGSSTVEMTFIFPVVIFVIVIMLFFGMFLYEQVAARAVLDDVVSRAAANWATADEGVYVEKSATEGFTVWDVYSRVLDFKDGARKRNIADEALRRLRIICPFSNNFQEGDVTTDSTNWIIYKSLNLTVDRTFALPFGRFLASLGVPTELHYRQTGSAIVEDPPEMIRTVDLAADYLEQTKLAGIYERAQSAMQKLTDFFRNLHL